MPKLIVCGRGGCGKSTLVTLLAKALGERERVLVVDTDESNLGLCKMLGQEPPEMSLMVSLGGKPVVREKLLASMSQENGEKVGFFREDLSLEDLPPACVSWDGSVGNLRIGKIEHSMEGCACPMGSITRSLLKELKVNKNDWVIADTEAGIEHFGRGVLEGVDAILMVVDPSYESILLAEKAKGLAEEAHKKFFVVLNKVDEATEPTLRQELTDRKIEVGGVINHSLDISRANLVGNTLDVNMQRESVDELVDKIIGLCR
ncbi:nitrogenase reductase [Desulfoscipio gibsoniae]|uniref:CO dehydrogenase maturation factor n=1 Tax=Desulfoscipio gibsoniae DSM 7213 TaxID=767817 RepID=R4KCS4_9FIRM|nr:nitrogenase reductase [Desulfoscipio gibsoniae]AGL00384.1 CO dehydrogenase maturation factor [Desulfoscipio gibsoniae DSM 7213]